MLTIMDFLSSRLLTLLEHMLISNLRNLGEAIAYNLRAMFGLKVPIVTVVIGEGGSGGALAIGCSNKIFMLENAVFFVASPEACAAILWKTSQAAPKAAEKLRITATELCKLKIADGIIPEPLGGAHTDPAGTSQQIKLVVTKAMKELAPMDLDTLLSQRHMKFRILGGFVEGKEVDPEKKRNMKRKEADLSQITADIEVEIENLKKAVQDAKGKTPVPTISDEAVEKLIEEVDKEMTNAFISMGLQEKLEAHKMELSKSPNASDQALNPVLKEKVDRLVQEFNHNLSRPGSFMSLKQKLLILSKVTKLKEKLLRGEKLKKELNEKLRAQVKDQIEILRNAREKVAKGEKLEEQVMKEVEKAKEEIQNMLKSVNLEVVGLGRKARTAPPGLKDKLKKADDVIYREIDKAIDMVGLRWKIDELKAEIASGTNKEKAETLWNDIMEEISAVLDWAEVKKKVEIALNEEAESSAEEQVPETVSVGTNWG